MEAVQRRKQKMVEDLIKVHLDRYEASGAELIMGEARFTSPKTVAVSLNNGGTRAIAGERVFLNVGTRATIPGIPGLAGARPMTHVEALELDRLPEYLIADRQRYAEGFLSRLEIIERGKNGGRKITRQSRRRVLNRAS
ncbi:MAG: hypothetical protein M3416_01655 [Acidobacteriota bacterium]|nr:hypothetical protein [Acidobacteriota bacterium]